MVVAVNGGGSRWWWQYLVGGGSIWWWQYMVLAAYGISPISDNIDVLKGELLFRSVELVNFGVGR